MSDNQFKYLLFAVLIGLAVQLQGCLLISSLTGPKKMKPVTHEELSKYLRTNKIDESKTYVLTESGFIHFVNKEISPISIFVIDFSGIAYSLRSDSVNCVGSIDGFFQQKNKNVDYLFPTNQLGKVDSLTHYIRKASGECCVAYQDLFNDQEYCVLIFWSKYFPKYNDEINGWMSTIESTRNVSCITINMDIQTFW